MDKSAINIVVGLCAAMFAFAVGRAFGLDFFGFASVATANDILLARVVVDLCIAGTIIAPFVCWRAPVHQKAAYVMWLALALLAVFSVGFGVGSIFRPDILLAMSADVAKAVWMIASTMLTAAVAAVTFSATRPLIDPDEDVGAV